MAIQQLVDASPSRRKLLRMLGIASAAAGAAVALDTPAQAQSSFTDINILNFALNLEYLEAEFYTIATTGKTISQINLTVSGSGVGADHIPPPSGKEYFPLDANAITEVRTPGQVLYLAVGSANASSGGFFPGGVNGLFTTSAAAAATSDTGTPRTVMQSARVPTLFLMLPPAFR